MNLVQPKRTLLSGTFRAALLPLAIVAVGCARRQPEPAPDVVLVSIDTLRADHLGCYGSNVGATPEIDRFSRNAVLFRTAIAQASSTLTSHASLFTSELPSRHGASFAARHPLPESALTVAEAFARAGYRTIGFSARGQLDPKFGIAQGFETFRGVTEDRRPGSFARTVSRALAAVDQPDPRPTFLFLHTYEVHHPYTPEPGILHRLDPDYSGELGDTIEVSLLNEINSGGRKADLADRRRIERAYDAEIASMDAGFGSLVAGLNARRRSRALVIAFTSDHGEEFGEHGYVGMHSHTLFDELLRVPLLVQVPNVKGRAVEMPVRSIDIAPTLLELAGVSAPPSFDGRSLVPLIRGESLRELPAISMLDDADPPQSGRSSVRWRGWKLNLGRFYDLETDRGETIDRVFAEESRAKEYLGILAAALAGRAAASTSVNLDPELQRELMSLGYLR